MMARPSARVMKALSILGWAVASVGAHAAELAHWKLDESPLVDGMAIADSAGDPDDGTLVLGSATSEDTLFNRGIRFTWGGGTRAEVKVPGIVPSGAAERSFAAWIWPSGPSDQGNNKIFGYGAPTAGNAFDVGYENGATQGTGSPGIFLRHWGGWIQFGDNVELADQFHHLVVRVNAGASTFADVQVFVDGVELPQVAEGGGGSAQVLNTSASGFSIAGSEPTPVPGFRGVIDEFRIYDHALSAQEIAELAVRPVLPLSIEVVGRNEFDAMVIEARGLDPAKTYALMRSTDLVDFSERVESEIDGLSSWDFWDQFAVEGAVFYRLEEVEPPAE